MRAERIATLLPEVVQRAAPTGSIIDGLLHVMATQHEPVEDLLADFGRYVDPYRCPTEFVPMLAHWVGFGWLLDQSSDHDRGSGRPQVSDSALRNLVFHAAELAKQRGTAAGLRRTLELATGHTGFEVTPGPGFSFVVRIPSQARGTRSLVALVVDHEKPAFTTATVELADDDTTPPVPRRGGFYRPDDEPSGHDKPQDDPTGRPTGEG